ncbi:MAG TPA: class I SAM-dependent methyltransferase [Tahibacter sp.]|uniref:class I SAM-dependent methyltransferase n=1 Tax=Tahibacter sp. TaxID=2056211 RepID=UPI002CF3BFC6|nr:class I SAM-dependent methyltransferase [Tahibacter sp.]HSX60501.1 class I SAM-dependent methyltransferase [Tahibacter sp.]
MRFPAPLHPSAATGFSEGADGYARNRPDYPPAIVDWLRDALALDATATAVDLGAGTGKFVPYLLAAGASVIAVEPVAGMRERLVARFPQIVTLDGTAEAMPLADASADAVVCATAFHWFATRDALAEIHRVLRPGGRLGLIWNVRDERTGWVARLSALFARYEDDTPRQHTQAWRAVFPFDGFAPLQVCEFAHEHEGSPEQVVVGRVLSTSFIAALPEPVRARVADEVRALIAAEPALAGRDRVAMPYRTMAYWTARTD